MSKNQFEDNAMNPSGGKGSTPPATAEGIKKQAEAVLKNVTGPSTPHKP